MFNEIIKEPNRMISVRASFDDKVFERENVYMFKTSLKGSLLSSVMETAELEIFGRHNVKNKEIKVEIGVKTFEMDEYVYKDFGLFVVDEYEFDDKLNTTRITKMYDKMVLSMKDYEGVDKRFPMTVKQYLQALSSKIGLQFKDSSFPNQDLALELDPYLEIPDVLYRDVLDEISQVIGGSIAVKGNTLQVLFPEKHGEPIEKGIGLKSSDIKETYGVINTVSSTREIEDVVYVEDEESVKTNGRTEIKIPTNQIFNRFDREIVLKELFEQLNGFSYDPAELETSGLGYYDYFDIIDLEDKEGKKHEVLITEIERTFDGGFTEKLRSTIPDDAKTDYNKASKTERDIVRTQAIVDKQNNTINLAVEKVEGMNDSITEIELNMEEILLLLEQRNTTNLWINSSGAMGDAGYTFDVEPIIMHDLDYPLIMGVQDYTMGRKDNLFDVIAYRGIADTAFEVKRDGKAFSAPKYLKFHEDLYFHVKVKGDGYQRNYVKFYLQELNEDKKEIKRTYLAGVDTPDDIIHLKKKITPNGDTKYISVIIEARGTPKHPVIIVEGMMSHTDYASYEVSVNDVLEYTTSQINLLEGNINLFTEKVEYDLDKMENRVSRAEIDIDSVKGITTQHDNRLSKAETKVNALDGITMKHENELHNASLDISADRGLVAKGRAFELQDERGNRRIFYDTNKQEFQVRGEIETNTDYGSTRFTDKGLIFRNTNQEIGRMELINQNVQNSNYSILNMNIPYADRAGIQMNIGNKTKFLLTNVGSSLVGTNSFQLSSGNLAQVDANNIGINAKQYTEISSPSIGLMGDTAVNGNLRISNGGISGGTHIKTVSGEFSSLEVGISIMPGWNLNPSIGSTNDRFRSIFLLTNPNVSSSRKLKHDITKLDGSFLLDLEPKEFRLNDSDDERKTMGFIAEELSELVGDDYTLTDGKSISYSELTAPIVDLLQKQQKQINKQQKEINGLKTMIKELI